MSKTEYQGSYMLNVPYEEVVHFFEASLQKVEESVREEMKEEMTKINLTFADSEDGDLHEGIKIGSELMKKDVLRIISKK